MEKFFNLMAIALSGNASSFIFMTPRYDENNY